MITNLLYLALLLIGFPLGLFLAKLCKEEIKNWRVRLFAMSVAALVLAVVVSFFRFEYKVPVIMALFFMIITDLTIIWKSH